MSQVCELGEPVDFLNKALDPPPTISVEAAMETLFEVGAVDRVSLKVTPLGFHLSSLPVDVHIGKTLLFSCILSCLDPILIIAASVSFRSPFMTVIGKEKEAANQAKLSFATCNSDHLTVYKVISYKVLLVTQKGLSSLERS
jgi:ATP-dependent RNA helicase DHX29